MLSGCMVEQNNMLVNYSCTHFPLAFSSSPCWKRTKLCWSWHVTPTSPLLPTFYSKCTRSYSWAIASHRLPCCPTASGSGCTEPTCSWATHCSWCGLCTSWGLCGPYSSPAARSLTAQASQSAPTRSRVRGEFRWDSGVIGFKPNRRTRKHLQGYADSKF